ncbi:MmgE/PrpD family protein [Sphingopyxis indica]|uniref:MmgE/PrpD family protein n=1 Tax=Sphingopyxis indica TaxID=436663 RepID=UPI00293945BF|nr:MmgE/PrpD family protein [Sphingopyxis indica]WOF42295.1 MmgE/PrpD family protein [Sphingopyxis indica]
MYADVTDRLCAAYAAIGFDDLPASTVAACSRVLLDASGVMMAASGMAPEARPFIDLAAKSPGPCTILGTGLTAAAPQAAFANGALAHALDYEDAFDAAPAHPNASLVPALLALAQDRGGVDGKRLVTALALGCDLSCRIGLALDRRMEEGGWYPPPINAAFGAALGAAHMLGLDARGLRDAISMMLCQAVMPGEIKYSRGTVLRAVREAFPAQAAVTSAELAASGVAGFETPLEGQSGFYALFAGGAFSPERLVEGIGERFFIEELTFKPWPSCRGTHPFIEIGLALAKTDPSMIESIEVEVSAVQQMLVDPLDRKRAPDVVIDAKFSIPFVMALAIVRGRVTLDDFAPASLQDPVIRAMARRISAKVVENSVLDSGAGGAASVRLTDGTRQRHTIPVARGAPSRPLGDDELVAKFVDCASRAAIRPDADRIDRLADAAKNIHEIKEVRSLFVPLT